KITKGITCSSRISKRHPLSVFWVHVWLSFRMKCSGKTEPLRSSSAILKMQSHCSTVHNIRRDGRIICTPGSASCWMSVTMHVCLPTKQQLSFHSMALQTAAEKLLPSNPAIGAGAIGETFKIGG